MSKKPINAPFDLCVIRKRTRSGDYSIACKLGLWAVSAPNEKQANREAAHYWLQYLNDGEYTKLLKAALK